MGCLVVAKGDGKAEESASRHKMVTVFRDFPVRYAIVTTSQSCYNLDRDARRLLFRQRMSLEATNANNTY